MERRVIERKHEILCSLIDYWKSVQRGYSINRGTLARPNDSRGRCWIDPNKMDKHGAALYPPPLSLPRSSSPPSLSLSLSFSLSLSLFVDSPALAHRFKGIALCLIRHRWFSRVKASPSSWWRWRRRWLGWRHLIRGIH